MANLVRGIVSQKKIRYTEDGFDLDLTYITPRIIAMGFPSEGTEGVYRNNMKDVQRFFRTKHSGGKFRIYNLCSERKYEAKHFDGPTHCAHYPFDDHNPSPFETIKTCCEDAQAFLGADSANVVAIHCKAGKGRTGMMISSLLMHLGEQKTAAEALDFFGRHRTANNKGVTIPSQIRWVYQYEQFLNRNYKVSPRVPFDFKGAPARITQFRVGPAPDFDTGGGCDPYFKIHTIDGKEIYNHKKVKGTKVTAWRASEPLRDFHVNIPVRGEFKVTFYDQDAMSKDDKMFGFWLHTSYLQPSVVLSKADIDGAVKDKKHKHFRSNFQCEILFADVAEAKGVVIGPVRASGAAAADDDEDDEDDEDPDFQLPSKGEKPKAGAAPAKAETKTATPPAKAGASTPAPAKAGAATPVPAKAAASPGKAPAPAKAAGAGAGAGAGAAAPPPPPPADDDIPPPPASEDD